MECIERKVYEIKKTKRQNKTIKHKSKHKVFLFIVKGKMKYLYNFIKTKFQNNMNLNQTFFLNEDIPEENLQDHVNTQYLNTEWRIVA